MKRRTVQGQRRSRLIAFVREHGQVDRGDIAREFSLDKKAVSILVEGLIQEKILEVRGRSPSAAGRRRDLLAVRADLGCFIGIDLGATHVIGVLTDTAGTVLDRAFFEIRPGLPVPLIVGQMTTIGRRLLASAAARPAVRAVGVCVPGFVAPGTGVSLVAENIPGWRDVKIREVFEKALGAPVVVDDSSRAFAAAERWLGHGQGSRDFVALDLGYGVGMGIVAMGSLYAGSGWKSGEIGHTVVEPNGSVCACGNRGCLETVASGRAIARQAAQGIRSGRSALLGELTHGEPDSVTAQDVGVAASMHDTFSIGLLEEAGRAVGLALANAVNLLNPSLVVLGGGLISAGAPFTGSIADALSQYAMPGIREDLTLVVSTLGVDASARGAATIAAAGMFASA